MPLTKKGDLNGLLGLCIQDFISVETTMAYLQDWIQQFGPLNENDPVVKQFLKKIGKNE